METRQSIFLQGGIRTGSKISTRNPGRDGKGRDHTDGDYTYPSGDTSNFTVHLVHNSKYSTGRNRAYVEVYHPDQQGSCREPDPTPTPTPTDTSTPTATPNTQSLERSTQVQSAPDPPRRERTPTPTATFTLDPDVWSKLPATSTHTPTPTSESVSAFIPAPASTRAASEPIAAPTSTPTPIAVSAEIATPGDKDAVEAEPAQEPVAKPVNTPVPKTEIAATPTMAPEFCGVHLTVAHATMRVGEATTLKASHSGTIGWGIFNSGNLTIGEPNHESPEQTTLIAVATETGTGTVTITAKFRRDSRQIGSSAHIRIDPALTVELIAASPTATPHTAEPKEIVFIEPTASTAPVAVVPTVTPTAIVISTPESPTLNTPTPSPTATVKPSLATETPETSDEETTVPIDLQGPVDGGSANVDDRDGSPVDRGRSDSTNMPTIIVIAFIALLWAVLLSIGSLTVKSTRRRGRREPLEQSPEAPTTRLDQTPADSVMVMHPTPKR